MANYTIIGGDGKQYGPITDADVRKWFGEGRLNALTQMKGESDAEFRALTAFPEFADLFPTGEPAFAAPVDWNTRDYSLDIGGCVSNGWALTKGHFGQLFVPIMIYFLIAIAIGALGQIPVIGGLFSIGNLFITGPLMAGVLYIFILTIRGQPAELGKMFDGFRSGYWQLFLGYLVPALFYLLCMAPFLVIYFLKVVPLLGQMQHAGSGDAQENVAQMKAVFFNSMPVFLIFMIPVIYLSINWQFTLPLIIDKQMDFWTAMKTSWKMVHKHWFAVFGLVVVIGLLNIVGVMACCIGLLFTIPLGFAALMYAYEIIFSESQSG